MADQKPAALSTYVDGAGHRFKMSEATAKRLGYKRVSAAKTETKVVEAEAETKPPARRTATTK